MHVARLKILLHSLPDNIEKKTFRARGNGKILARSRFLPVKTAHFSHLFLYYSPKHSFLLKQQFYLEFHVYFFTLVSEACSTIPARYIMTEGKAQKDAYLQQCLSVVVIGASGDLAKKKTYPALYALSLDKSIPQHTIIWGYARSDMSDQALRDQLRPYLEQHCTHKDHSAERLNSFLKLCVYRKGEYGSKENMAELVKDIEKTEKATGKAANRMFYFAIPPFVFVDVAAAIKAHGVVHGRGWTRLVVEKPFGRDTESSEKLSKDLGMLFDESHLYRIDHYLGKEMVQNLLVMRFANTMFEPIWNSKHVACVYITFKEPFGTEGRGGYFDEYGIIRDVMQNHLMQILTLVAMEPPLDITDGDSVRDEKVKVLRSMEVIDQKDVVLGQYVGSKDGTKPGYKDDDSLKNKESKTPTFASMIMRVNNPSGCKE
eukprot:g58255.t1